MQEHPLARCTANEVEAWSFPFYITRERGLEPAFIYLEDHLYNLEGHEEEIRARIVKISSEEDLQAEGFSRGDDGVWIVV